MAYTRYKVKEGESLSQIANRYNVDVADVKRLNNLSGSNVSAGTTLSIPPSNRNSSFYTATGQPTSAAVGGIAGIVAAGTNIAGNKNTSGNGYKGVGNAGSSSSGSVNLGSSGVNFGSPSLAGGYDPSSNAAYNAAISALNAALAQTPTYAGTYDKALQEIYDKIMNRDPFSFDLNSDILYNQYKDQYMRLGELAMMDTMGQAAALTGGYGSSYSQAVGQQTYNAYLQQLNQIVPDIYQMAYDRYMQEGNEMQNQFAVTSNMQQGEYQRYQDALNNWWNQVNYYTGRADTAYSQGQSEYWNTLNYNTNQQNTAYDRALAAAQLTGDFSGMGSYGWTNSMVGNANRLASLSYGGSNNVYDFEDYDPVDLKENFTEYTVQSGDTLKKIADRYNVDEKEIQHLNDMAMGVVRPGQKLYIPPSNPNSPYYW